MFALCSMLIIDRHNKSTVTFSAITQLLYILMSKCHLKQHDREIDNQTVKFSDRWRHQKARNLKRTGTFEFHLVYIYRFNFIKFFLIISRLGVIILHVLENTYQWVVFEESLYISFLSFLNLLSKGICLFIYLLFIFIIKTTLLSALFGLRIYYLRSCFIYILLNYMSILYCNQNKTIFKKNVSLSAISLLQKFVK